VVDSRLQVAKQRKRGPAKQFCKLLKHWLIGIRQISTGKLQLNASFVEPTISKPQKDIGGKNL